jgi:hypothetical protein
MRTLLRVVFGAALLLTLGCTRRQKVGEVAKPADTSTPGETSLFALPVVAPMRARERLLNDTGKQNDAARARKADFNAVLEGRDR